MAVFRPCFAMALCVLLAACGSLSNGSGTPPSTPWNSLPASAQPEVTYAALAARVSPAPGSDNAPIDTPLTLRFDEPPVLGDIGSVHLYRVADNKKVDTIRLEGESDQLGYAGQDQRRELRVQPFFINDNTLVISLHHHVLKPGTEYYVAVDAGVLKDATLGGEHFVGIGKATAWRFTTRASLPEGAELTVNDDGEADFRTVQGALNHAMEYLEKDEQTIINIRDGLYHQPLFLRGKNNITLRGESRDGTVLQYRNSDAINSGTANRNVFLVENVDGLTLENLTLRNTILRSDPDGAQAETIYFNSDDGRLIARNVAFYSEQDTLLLKGYSWFYQTLVAGNVDFIWGYPQVALFEDSEIRSVGDSRNSGSGGYVLQARAPEGATGFVFLDSRLTHGPGPAGNDVPHGSAYLARSGGKAENFDNIVFINCAMDSHIADIGWAGDGIKGQPAPNPSPGSVTMGWREFGSVTLEGAAPIDLEERHSSVRILTADEVHNGFNSRATIFSSYPGGWNPEP